MTNKAEFGRLLLLTTAIGALVSWPVLAQTAATAAPPAEQQPAEAADEEVDVVGPGAGAVDAEDIVVIGRSIPNSIRATPSVVSVLSQADIARTGEGDIAGALQRVSGLSLVGGKYVYVRGLGERYSSALLNGLPLPSPEPLKRVVPLDIFPTSVIASSVVQKSYSPNFPGEFGGGVINLTTRAIPEERFVEIGGSVGGNTITTGRLGYTHFGSRTDWTGFDNGARSIPVPLRGALNSGNRVAVGENFDLARMQTITAGLLNAPTNLIQRNDTIPADLAVSFTAGDSFDVGENRLGVIVSFGWDNGWETQGGLQQTAAGVAVLPDGTEGLRADQDYRFLSTENRIVVNGLFGVGFEFGEHVVRWTNVFVRDSLKESRIQSGLDEVNVGNDNPVNRNFTSWIERQLFTTQLVSEFKFGDWSVNARGTYAKSSRNAPYERLNSYVFAPEVKGYINDLTSNGSRSIIAFSDLQDEVYGGVLDVAYRLPTERPFVLSAGYAYTDNSRTAERRDFRYVVAGGSALPIAVAQTRPDYLLSAFNTFAYDVVLQEVSGAQGAARYDASLVVHGVYGQLEAELLDGLRIQGGVRYEDGTQIVAPAALFGQPALPSTTIDESYWLPGVTVTWNFAEDMQFRVAASKTLARPQFRELAPQSYRDTDTDRTAFGNQFLVDSQLTNLEARYEWFFDRDQRLVLSGFWKKIDRPIETISFDAGGTFATTYANAPEATLYGAEVEAVKYLYLDGAKGLLEGRRILLSGNYTYSKSKLKVGADDVFINEAGEERAANSVFRNGQPLTGQSEHVGNVQFGLSHEDRLSEQTILLNYASDRVTQRGPLGTPDYVEKPGLQLDFVAREDIMMGKVPMELKFEVRNITGTKYQEVQELGESRIDVNSYRRGTSFSLGLTAKF